MRFGGPQLLRTWRGPHHPKAFAAYSAKMNYQSAAAVVTQDAQHTATETIAYLEPALDLYQSRLASSASAEAGARMKLGEHKLTDQDLEIMRDMYESVCYTTAYVKAEMSKVYAAPEAPSPTVRGILEVVFGSHCHYCHCPLLAQRL